MYNIYKQDAQLGTTDTKPSSYNMKQYIINQSKLQTATNKSNLIPKVYTIENDQPKKYQSRPFSRTIQKRENFLPYNMRNSDIKNYRNSFSHNVKTRSQQEIQQSAKKKGIYDKEVLQKFLNFQLQLNKQKNEQESYITNEQSINQNNSQMKKHNQQIIKIGQLEGQIEKMELEIEKQNQIIENQKYELEKRNKELEQDQKKNQNLIKELENCQQLRDKLDESMFEINKLENERDYHHRNHVELRRKLYNQSNNNYQIKQLKRESHYLQEELIQYKNRNELLQKQINELIIFAEKPRTEKQQTTEIYYANKIIELENTIKEQQQKIFNLQNFQNEENAVLNTNNILNNQNSDSNKQLQLEIETLKVKLETSKRQNVLLQKQIEQNRNSILNNSRSMNDGVGNAQKYRRIMKKYLGQIEQLKIQLKQQKSNHTTNAHEEQIIREQRKKIQDLQQQLDNKQQKNGVNQTIERQRKRIQELEKQAKGNNKITDLYSNDKKIIERQRKRIEELEIEIKKYKNKISNMEREFELKQNKNVGRDVQKKMQDQELQIKNLIDVNNKLTYELNAVQEELRKLESINRSSVFNDYENDPKTKDLLKQLEQFTQFQNFVFLYVYFKNLIQNNRFFNNEFIQFQISNLAFSFKLLQLN